MNRLESFDGRPREKVTAKPETVNNTELSELSKEQIEDYLFDQYMKQQLLEVFFDSLGEHLNHDEIEKMRATLSEHSDEEIYAALSLPYELREKKFKRFAELIDGGRKTPEELAEELVVKAKQYGFGVGYHTSPKDMRPTEDGRWTIQGFESDHRDSNLSKAYYSKRFRHLYKEKNPQFIYIVRTDPETHNTDGNWHRAGALSVVARVPFKDVVSYVQSTANEIKNGNGK